MKSEARWAEVLAYLDGRMESAERVRFESELHTDPELAAEVEAFQHDWELLGDAMPDGSWSAQEAREFAARIETAAHRERRPSLHRVRLLVATGLAAAAVLCLAWLLRDGGESGGADPSADVVAEQSGVHGSATDTTGADAADGTENSTAESVPEFLADPSVLADLEVILDLDELEAAPELLELDDESLLFDLIGLELLSGA